MINITLNEGKLKMVSIGNDNFKEMREKDMYFVDKSELISDIIADGSKVYLFARPRRFGKSLNLSMLDAFFNMKYKGNKWFDGLKVSEHAETFEHKNAYPVIYLRMKELPVDDYNRFISKMSLRMSKVYENFDFIFDSIKSPVNSDLFSRCRWKKLSESELCDSLQSLSEMVSQHYGINPIVLIDEYDKPINDSFNQKDYKKILNFLRDFYSSALKSNESLSFAVVTGVMQIAKEFIFSGLNNLKVNNIFTEKFDERYGFTESEVRELCAYYGHPEKFDEAKEWYDGYRFGNADIYNPWSLLSYIDSGFKPKKYWAGTSGNDIIETLIAHADSETYKELQALGEGETITESLQPTISMRDLSSDTSTIYSVMAVAGYLKAYPLDSENYRISIPNLEMRRVFSFMLLKKVDSKASVAFGQFFNGMEAVDVELMKKGLDKIFDHNIPFFVLSDEKSYQLILAASAMSRLGRYKISIEKESGNGRADIIMRPTRPGIPNIIFELKKSRAVKPKSLKRAADEGISQIKEKKYFRGMTGRVLLYGICFHGKDAVISFEELDLRFESNRVI